MWEQRLRSIAGVTSSTGEGPGWMCRSVRATRIGYRVRGSLHDRRAVRGARGGASLRRVIVRLSPFRKRFLSDWPGCTLPNVATV
jgi:hypothetical protein